MKFELNEYHRDIQDAELLEDIKRVAEMIKPAFLSREKYRELGKYGSKTVCRRFGSWTKALELCNINLSPKQQYATLVKNYRKEVSNDELIADIQRVAQELGKETISSGEYKQYGYYSADSCYRRFTTWNNALIESGLKPCDFIPGRKLNNHDLFKEIERMWIAMGRQPTATDVRDGMSRFSLNTYARHFGGWRNALVAFINWVNNEDENDTTDSISLPVKRKTNDYQIHTPSPQVSRPIHSTSREINLRLRFKVMQRDNFKCCLCGASPAKDPSVELHIDHIKPWSKGGETTIDNLRTLCSKCNLGKSDLYDE